MSRTDLDWWSEKLSDVGNTTTPEQRLLALQEINTTLKKANRLEANILKRLLCSPEIFDVLGSASMSNSPSSVNVTKPMTEKPSSDLAMDTLSICMNNLSLKESDFTSLLKRALEHPTVKVKALALNTLLRELRLQLEEQQQQQSSSSVPKEGFSPTSNSSQNKMPLVVCNVSPELLEATVEALRAKETELGGPALNILSIASSVYFEQPSFRLLMEDGFRNGDDTVKCRIYELAVNIAQRSADNLQRVSFILDHAVSEFTTKRNGDVLFQMNLLEILSNLTKENHGLLYMEKHKVLEKVNRCAICFYGMDEDNGVVDGHHISPSVNMNALLEPSVMKFFGKVASVQPQKAIPCFPRLMYHLFELICSDDIHILPIAFDTFANLVYTQQGVTLLESNYGNNLETIFSSYYDHLKRLPAQLKDRVFHSLENIFRFEPANSVSGEVSNILSYWFSYLNNFTNTMDFLYEYCTNPFPDIKASCLRLVNVLCTYSWGVIALSKTGGLLEFLLDRSTEFDKEVKYIKYEIIEKLSRNTANVFSEDVINQLKKFVLEGPFYVQAIMDVVVEGN